MSRFQDQVSERAQRLQSLLCVGLDPVPEKLPEGISRDASGLRDFCHAIVDTTADSAVCYKPNSAFFEALGAEGYAVLGEVIAHCHARGVPVILDAKRGDIGSTAQRYAVAAFERLEADALTINAYLGLDGVKPFQEYKDRTSFVLCYTSNPSRVDFQTIADGHGKQVYTRMAEKIAEWNQKQANLGAVVGATAPDELQAVRDILGPEAPILCPGVGAQGGDLEASLRAGIAPGGVERTAGSLLVNASRAVIYASAGSDFAQAAGTAAKELQQQMASILAAMA